MCNSSWAPRLLAQGSFFPTRDFVSGPLMKKKKSTKGGVIERQQMSIYFLFPTTIVMLTNANGRSKLGLCSAKHSLRCCFHSDYACEGTHLSLTAVFEKKSGIFVYRGMVHRLKNVNMKGERGGGGGGRRKRRQSRRETPRVTPVWHFCQTRQEEKAGAGPPSASDAARLDGKWHRKQTTRQNTANNLEENRDSAHTKLLHAITSWCIICDAKQKKKKKKKRRK